MTLSTFVAPDGLHDAYVLTVFAVVGGGVMSPEDAAKSIHLPTILLLFSFMVISAQMRLGGFYSAITRRIVALQVGPAALMGVVIAVAAALSAVFSNDIVCLAVAPVLAEACLRRRLDPVPFLLGLACASNIGSAATLIGNPQNMLIGEVLRLPFAAYTAEAIGPVGAGLVALWALLAWQMRRTPPVAEPDPAQLAAIAAEVPPFDRWQTAKGLLVALALVGMFLFTDWPRDVAALVGAGVLLLSQRFHSSKVMGLIDWELLILFMGLFVVNHALELTGLTPRLVAWLTAQGIDLAQPVTLFFTTLGLSNLVSNVPAVMVLMPLANTGSGDHVGVTLALVSTMAGNLLIVGSIANLIVVDAARRCGIVIDWRRHARTGAPVAVVTLGIVAGWLAVRHG
ncbi:anion transporter [Sphaerotilus sp.]|uniref:anion transporter n=1 Tax=Sphaerotilus sp. TaxID=2093942 RepID=UPI002ACE4A51|nr:anion transporter [Sphaerotilus sp.]MDZ7858122.1 anion transporter [Sphaerotilus sp.]